MANTSLPIYELGNDFYDTVTAGDFSNPKIRYRNIKVANNLDLDKLTDDQWINHFSKFHPLDNNLSEPLALRYHGHQFQHYNPELGDGRGFLFAQFLKNNNVFEFGTKGSGTTPYSRRGDGRLTLKGAIREALCTAYLQFQSVNSSKTFSVIETGEYLIRHDEPSPTRSSVLVRYSHGHIRIGSFQRALFYQHKENIDKLIHYSLKYFYPEHKPEDQPHRQFLKLSTWRLADLVASYIIAGFVHGVLNTDNINISGESFDYGPYRFTPRFDPHFTAAYFDSQGLYCFGRQPAIFQWNIEQLKKCLIFANPDFSWDTGLHFGMFFQFHLVRRFLRKLQIIPKNLQKKSAFYNFLNTQTTPEKNPWLVTADSNSYSSLSAFLENDLYADILNNEDFKKAEKLMEQFFQFQEENPSALLEDSYFFLTSKLLSIENQTTRRWDNEFANNQSLTELITEVQNNYELNQEQGINKNLINYLSEEKPQSLLIDEIEAIWQAIDEKEDWLPFYTKIEKLSSLNDIYQF